MATNGGADVPRKSGKLKYVLGGVVAVILLLGGGAAGLYFYADYANKKTAEQRRKNVETDLGIAVTAHDLAQEYDRDAKAADARYKDKVVVVSGKVQKTEGNIVTLSGPILWHVNCELGEANKGAVAGVELGSDVTIKGVCTGKAFDGGDLGLKVVLKECKLEK